MSAATWEPVEHLGDGCQELIEHFYANRRAAGVGGAGGVEFHEKMTPLAIAARQLTPEIATKNTPPPLPPMLSDEGSDEADSEDEERQLRPPTKKKTNLTKPKVPTKMPLFQSPPPSKLAPERTRRRAGSIDAAASSSSSSVVNIKVTVSEYDGTPIRRILDKTTGRNGQVLYECLMNDGRILWVVAVLYLLCNALYSSFI